MYLFGNGCKSILIVLINSKWIERHSVREIFVDETLLKINGKYFIGCGGMLVNDG